MPGQVLLTGGAGFVGNHLAARLGEDAIVSQADVRDPAALADELRRTAPRAIVHLAALSSVAESWADPVETWRVNTLGTVNVLEAARTERPRARVIVASTGEVYGRAAQLPATEETPVAPLSPYAASKAAAELACAPIRAREELDLVITRSFNTEGPGRDDRFAVGSWASQITELEGQGGGTLLVGDLSAKRDVVDVRDAARAYELLLAPSVHAGTYNIASGRGVTMEEILEILIGLAACEIQVERDQARVRPVDVPELWGDASKLAGETGWQPEISLEQTLGDTLDYARRTVTRGSRT